MSFKEAGISLSEVASHTDTLIANQLTPDERIVSLDRVYVASHGVYICWILDFYNNLVEDEENKIGKAAGEFRIPEESVEASLAYYSRHRDILDARILLNKTAEEMVDISGNQIQHAEEVIENAEGIKDSVFLKNQHKP